MVAKKRKLTKREPKRIIKRKKATARKPKSTTAKTRATKTVAKATTRTSRVDQRAADLKDVEKIRALQSKGLSLKDAAEKVGMRPAKARRLLQGASVRPKDKIVGTDAEMGKKIKAARAEGVSWGVLRARTGLTTRKVKALYASAGGKATSAKRATAKTKKTATKATRKAKTNTRTAKRSTKSTKKVAGKSKATASRAPRTARKPKVKEPAAEPSGLTSRQRRRAKKNAESKKRLEVLWNLDSSDKQVTDAVEGSTVEVTREMGNGRKVTPTEHTIMKIKSIGYSDREGRVVHFVDENQQDRVITSREVTAVR